jgi:peptidoglycan-associated lipoprotein
MSTTWKVATYTLCLAVVMTMGAGCKRKQTQLTVDPAGSGPAGIPGGGGTVGMDQPGVDLDSILFGPSGLQAVYFDYDSSAIRADAAATLRRNADMINQNPNVLIQLAGHCDERGTQEYNFALGERRALSVRDHLITLGVSGGRLVTISYGEEFPAVLGSNEAAWAQNRRVEFNRAQ